MTSRITFGIGIAVVTYVVHLLQLGCCVEYDYDPLDPSRDGFKSIGAIPMPSTQSFDRHGNIILNGRYGKEPANFEMKSVSRRGCVLCSLKIIQNHDNDNFHLENELSITFCVDGEHSGCVGNGLVLCFPSPSHIFPFPHENLNERQRNIKATCGSKNGIAVSTEHKTKPALFRIDTAYGNTYKFPIPFRRCFVLWLLYDDPEILTQSVESVKYFSQRFESTYIYPVTFFDDSVPFGSAAKSLGYSSDYKHIMTDINNRTVRMLWKEIIVWPHLNETYSTIPFVALGGGECCALKVHMNGPQMIKCYHNWVQIGGECRAAQVEHQTECEVPYTVGWSQSNHSKERTFAKNEALQNENQQKFEKIINKNHTFVDNTTTNFNVSDIEVHIRKNNDETLKNDLDLNIYGGLTISGELAADPLFVTISAQANGNYSNIDNTDDVKFHDKDLKDEEKSNSDKNLHNKTLYRTDTENQESLGNVISDYRQSKSKTKTSKILEIDMAETHTVHNIITWPDASRAAQLQYTCMGQTWLLNITEIFSNNAQLLTYVSEKEKLLGYLDPMVLEKCPYL